MGLNFADDDDEEVDLFPTSRESDLGIQQHARATFTKEYFLPAPNDDGTAGSFTAQELRLGGSEEAHLTILLPEDFTGIKKLSAIFVASVGHNDWPIRITYMIAQKGDTFDAVEVQAIITPDLQTDKFEEIEIGQILDGTVLKPGDFLGIEVENQHLTESELSFLGIRLEYE